MRRTVSWTLAAVAPLVVTTTLFAQRENWSRESREPIELPGGSRVEFSSMPSDAIHGEEEFSVFLPPSYAKSSKSYPVVYFLHGLFNDHTSWTVDNRGDIPKLVDELMSRGDVPEMVLVHPNGDRSFYTDFHDGTQRYEKLVVEELPAAIEARYRVTADRAHRAIAGTSMGGYGALKIAMRHPDRYAAVAAHSPIVFPVKNPMDVPEQAKASRQYQYLSSIFAEVYGNPFSQAYFDENNPIELAARPDIAKLGIYFDYGTADRYDGQIGLGAGLRKLDQALTAHGVAHVFRTHDGEPHGWALVYTHLPESLKFLAEHLAR